MPISLSSLCADRIENWYEIRFGGAEIQIAPSLAAVGRVVVTAAADPQPEQAHRCVYWAYRY